MNRLLVIRGGAIGDFILTLPALKALRDAYPNAHLEILGYKHIAALAENRFYAQRVRSLESARLSRFFTKDTNLPPELAKYFAAFDLVMSYLYDPDSIFEDNLQRSGARKIMWGPAKIANSSHAALQLAQPVEELGLPISDFAQRLYPSSEDRHRALEFVAGLAAPIVAFHPGSGSDEKNWPLQSWIDLGNHFLKDFAGSLAIVSGEADEHQTRQLESIWQNPRVRFVKNLVLGQVTQWRHQEFRIERDRKIAAFVLHRQRFFGFADFRSVRGDVDVVLGEVELDRVRFLARQKRHAAQ